MTKNEILKQAKEHLQNAIVGIDYALDKNNQKYASDQVWATAEHGALNAVVLFRKYLEAQGFDKETITIDSGKWVGRF